MSMMNETRFEELAAAYGATLSHWPAEEQSGAQALLETSAQAQAVLADAKALDATLDLWDAPQPSGALMARILGDAAEIGFGHAPEAAPRAEPEKSGLMTRLFGDWGWRPAGAMAACLAIGFVAGLSGAPAPLGDAGDIASVSTEETLMDMAFFSEDESDPFGLETL